MENRQTRYLFETVSPETLRHWVQRLRYFRFLRAVGGHANDGDSLNAALRYEGEADLWSLLTALRIALDASSENPSHQDAEASSLRPSYVPQTAMLRQPGHCKIGGSDVFPWCSASSILISANPRSYTVEEVHIAAAARVEVILQAMAHRVLDPPGDSLHYLCPQNYPDLAW